ncbi:hypothetical protein FQN54_003084 [Arachnomyces sp. PD_36]|nr:hypothetical protein FQN54_003084 [Arachnomyces sp. PD_36]
MADPLNTAPHNTDTSTTSTHPQHTTTSGTTTTSTGTGKTTSGPHKSDLLNKLDPRVDSKKHQEYPQHHDVATSGHGGTVPGTTTTTGTPHGMGMGNGATTTSGVGGSHTTTEPHTTTAAAGSHNIHTTAPFNSHQSTMERQAQPQGTFDHRPHHGAGAGVVGGGTIPHNGATAVEPGMHEGGLTGNHHSTTTTEPGMHGGLPGNTHSTTTEPGMHGGGLTGNSHSTTTTHKPTAGPHHSKLANKLDPRVDSDLSGGHPTTAKSDRYYAGAGDGAGTGQAPLPSMINQGDPAVQGGTGGLGGHHQHHQTPVAAGAGGGMPGLAGHSGATTHGTHAPGAYPEGGHHTVTGGTHGGVLPHNGGTTHHTTTHPTTTHPTTTHPTTTHPAATHPTTGGTTHPTGTTADPHSTTHGTHTGTSSGGGLIQGVKAAAAGFHGAGETLRGALTGKVDRSFGDSSGTAKNEAVMNNGMNEIETGRFSDTTREREGARPKRY